MGDLPVLPGMEIWVAVVANDTSGNAYLDDLTVVSSQAVDDGFDDSGDYMTPVEDLQTVWNDVGILVTWSGRNSGEVRGYKIYIGDEGLTQITAYTEVGEVRASTNFLITSDVFEDLDNLTQLGILQSHRLMMIEQE